MEYGLALMASHTAMEGNLFNTLTGALIWRHFIGRNIHPSWYIDMRNKGRYVVRIGIGDGDIGDAERAVLSDVPDGTVTP